MINIHDALRNKKVIAPRTFSQNLGSKILLPDLPQERINGRRYYVTPQGDKHPSVTTFLKTFQDMDQIDRWKKRVGEAEANRISKRSCDRGEAIHLALEAKLKNHSAPRTLVPDEFAFMYDQIAEVVDKYLDSYIYLEHALYSDRIKIAGRADLCGYWRGKLSMIDFKNKNRKPSEDTLHHYFLQAATYAIMHYDCYGESIENLVILASIEKGKGKEVLKEAIVYERDPAPFVDEVYTMIQSFQRKHPEYYDLTPKAVLVEMKKAPNSSTSALF